MSKLPSLSIFFPFWNEEKNIEQVVESAIPHARKIAEKWEIIIIDDGSVDKTFQKATNLSEKYKNVRVVRHSPNRGYGSALKSGFEHAKYEYVVFTDGDGQFDFSEITKFCEEITGADMVVGFRKKRQDHNLFKRMLLMNLLKAWDFLLFGFYFKDIDCGFKMFRRDALLKLGSLRSEGAMITTEIFAKAKIRKLRIVEVGVQHYPRKHGSQSGANFYVIVRAVLESLVLWLDIKNGRF